MLEPTQGVRVIAVESLATGAGKTPLAAKLARSLHRSGVSTVVLRHPLSGAPEGAHVARSHEDIRDLPIDLQEQLEPVVGAGVPAVYGTSEREMLDAAAATGSVVVWDGGGDAEPWVRPDVRVLAVDLLRALPETAERRVREANVLVLTKADSAEPGRARETERRVREWNAQARAFLADMPIAVPESARIVGRAVLVVESAASLVLGGFNAGAGSVAAKRFRCGLVDPRPHAVGTVARVLQSHPHIGPVVPALGRTRGELDDLRQTISATPCEAVLWASAASPDGIVRRPVVRAYTELIETAGGSLQDVIRPFLPGESGPLRVRRR